MHGVVQWYQQLVIVKVVCYYSANNNNNESPPSFTVAIIILVNLYVLKKYIIIVVVMIDVFPLGLDYYTKQIDEYTKSPMREKVRSIVGHNCFTIYIIPLFGVSNHIVNIHQLKRAS
jgi:hypothetical protein